MSVYRAEYAITGVKFGKERWDEIFGTYEDLLYSLEDPDKGKPQWVLFDGMSGDYIFFGIIKRLVDGYDEENTQPVEFDTITKKTRDNITKNFEKYFPDLKMPKIKNYYVPHYH